MEKLRIAIIAPPVTTVPPFGQGGIETILANKINALVKMGHSVTLYGVGESSLKNIGFQRIFDKAIAQIEIDPVEMEASRKIRLETTYMISVLLELVKNQQNYDVIFNHTRATELTIAPFIEKFTIPFLNIFHLPILKEHIQILEKVPKLLTISISDDQRADYPELKNFVGTVHNGINPEEYPINTAPEDSLLWVGTIGYHKNPAEAIQVAKALKMKIYLMGKIRDEDYFEKFIKPQIDNIQIKYLGELNYQQKLPYFQKAKLALFPTKIREACPVTPLELTMCGTPVVAYPSGGTKELIEDGINGFLVENINAMIEKSKEAINLDRATCHEFTKNNFSSQKMAENYLTIYQKVKNETSN